jgi:hypothetical protein
VICSVCSLVRARGLGGTLVCSGVTDSLGLGVMQYPYSD